MKEPLLKKIMSFLLFFTLAFSISGCAALKKKFTPKKKKKSETVTYHKLRQYDVKPSMELYEKHYAFWSGWHKKLSEKLGESYKNDTKCLQEMMKNLESMATLLLDEKAALLIAHIEALKEVESVILNKGSVTTANETRIRRILEREHRVIRREFSPRKVVGHIREEW